MTEKTQQDRLTEIIKTDIHPTLKTEGFKKKGRWFRKQEGDYTKALSIYSSQWNTADDCTFRFEFHLHKGDKPIAEYRIPRDPETGKSNDYRLTPEVDTRELGAKIREDLSRYVLASFDEYIERHQF